MNKQLLTIGEASRIIGVSVVTLRRWEQQGILKSFRPSLRSNRYYRVHDVEDFLDKKKPMFQNADDVRRSSTRIEDLATAWVHDGSSVELSADFYCNTSDVFQARLQKLEKELSKISSLKDIYNLLTAIVGEIGNNSYNHNIGNWPDVPGIFFSYDISRRIVVLADRGRGVYTTLKRVVPNLHDHQDALRVAFTEYVSGRAPEDRGNGLKFVRDVLVSHSLQLKFFTGNAALELEKGTEDLKIRETNKPFHGCLAFIYF